MRRSATILVVAAVCLALGAGVAAEPRPGTRPTRPLPELVAASTPGATIRVPDGVTLAGPEPLEIDHDLVVEGAGVDASVLSASGTDGVFDLAPGATLTLRDISLDGARTADPDDTVPGGRVRLERTRLGPPASAVYRNGLEYCSITEGASSQFYAEAAISDPTALARVPGAPFA